MMEPRTLEFIEKACQGQLVSGDHSTIVRRVCIDSRLVKPGDLFVAIEGDSFNGHDFTKQAIDRGAVAALVNGSRVSKDFGGTKVEVVETRHALGLLASHYRNDFDIPLIAIGGSNGKTSTKEILTTILRQRFRTLCSEASFNNEIGVPLTLLRLKEDHQFAIVEIGTNHPGELQSLLSIACPKYGILTSIGSEHLEFFGDLEGVLFEEGFLAESLPEDGILFVNGGIEGLAKLRKRCRATVITVGESNRSDWIISSIELSNNGTIFKLISPKGDWDGVYRVNLLGRHNALNAALAIAVAVEMGLSQEELIHGLQDCRPASMRMQLQTLGGVTVINDAYNSNPDSLQAALETLKAFQVKGKVIAVLGDMVELGEASENAHIEAGMLAAKLGLNGLIAVGQWADVTVKSAQANGLANVAAFEDATLAGKALASKLKPEDLLLVKGSRSTKLERIIEELVRILKV